MRNARREKQDTKMGGEGKKRGGRRKEEEEKDAHDDVIARCTEEGEVEGQC